MLLGRLYIPSGPLYLRCTFLHNDSLQLLLWAQRCGVMTCVLQGVVCCQPAGPQVAMAGFNTLIYDGVLELKAMRHQVVVVTGSHMIRTMVGIFRTES